MLIGALGEHADVALLVLSDAGTITRGEVRDRAEAIVGRSGDAFRGRAVTIGDRATFDNVAWLVALERLGAVAVVPPPSLRVAGTPGLEFAGDVGVCSSCGFGIWRGQEAESTGSPVASCAEPSLPCVRDLEDQTKSVPGLLLLHKSGEQLETAHYAWPDLLERVRSTAPAQGARWLLTEPLSAFGGMHVLLAAILGRGTVCVPFPDQPDRQLDAAAAAGVTHLSGTPAFFQGALAAGAAQSRDWAPRHIAVGGTPVPADLLDGLRQRFPAADLTNIGEQ